MNLHKAMRVWAAARDHDDEREALRAVERGIFEIMISPMPDDFIERLRAVQDGHPTFNQSGYLQRTNQSYDPVDKVAWKTYLHYELFRAILEPGKTWNTEYSSYNFKHLVEEILGIYMPNGCAIASMLLCGFETVPGESRINATAKISKRSANIMKRLCVELGVPDNLPDVPVEELRFALKEPPERRKSFRMYHGNRMSY